MDSHISGPRGGNAQGAIVSANIAHLAYAPGGDPQSGHDIFRTYGATPKSPIMVRGTVSVLTAFNGSGTVVKIVHTNLNGGDEKDFIAVGATAPVTLMLIEDRIFQGVYTPGAGSSAGNAGFLLEAVGKGVPDIGV